MPTTVDQEQRDRELQALLTGGRPEPARYSMSTLRRVEQCVLSTKLARDFPNTGPEAVWGRAYHECLAAVAFACSMREVPALDPALALTMAHTVLERLDEPLDLDGRRLVLEWVQRTAPQVTFPVDADYFGVEELWETPLPAGGHTFTLSGRLDWVAKHGTTVEVEDYKTGRYTPDSIAGAFQPRHYSWQAARRWPDTDTYVITERYVRKGVPRTVVYTREDVEGWIEPGLRMLAHRLRRAYATNRFKANPGSWCATCTAPEHCPLPQESRPESIGSHADLVAIVEVLAPLKARVAKYEKAVRTFMKEWDVPPVPVGDQALGYREVTKRRLDEKLAAAAGVDLDQFRVAEDGREFAWRKV